MTDTFLYYGDEALLERLAAPTATVDDCYQLLNGQYQALLDRGQGEPPSTALFFRGDADLQMYKRAVEWWPTGKHVPARLVAPSLWQLLQNYDAQDHPWGNTFEQRLIGRSVPVMQWLNETELDVHSPNAGSEETAQERAARLARESQARYRERQRAIHSARMAPYHAAIEERRRVLAEHDQAVRAAEAAYHAACAARKQARADQDALVRAARPAGSS